ncbi:hypothetical protein [Streptomyces sp. NPDC056304]|uniref:hypothetical protein n=1 Tax=Streptomyces sp. NPDC056304 TaxID=3345778 RepID=UPI0035DD66A3
MRIGAALAAASALVDADVPPLRLLESLESLIFNTMSTYHEFSAAISALLESQSEEADEILFRAIDVPSIGVQAQAAIALAERDFPAYRGDVTRVARSWPQNAEFPATKLLSLLREEEGTA